LSEGLIEGLALFKPTNQLTKQSSNQSTNQPLAIKHEFTSSSFDSNKLSPIFFKKTKNMIISLLSIFQSKIFPRAKIFVQA